MHLDNFKLWTSVLTVEYLSFKLSQVAMGFRVSLRHFQTRDFITDGTCICSCMRAQIEGCLKMIFNSRTPVEKVVYMFITLHWCVQMNRMSLFVIHVNEIKYNIQYSYNKVRKKIVELLQILFDNNTRHSINLKLQK